MSEDFVYCTYTETMCKRKYFEDCSVLKRQTTKYFRGQVFPYDCPKATAVWLARQNKGELRTRYEWAEKLISEHGRAALDKRSYELARARLRLLGLC